MTFCLRSATPLDAGQTGWILHRFAAVTPWMPALHSEAEAISFCGEMIDRGWVTVAGRGRDVHGFLARDGQQVHALYVAPEACGQGIGKALLDAAKVGQLRLQLQTFQANDGARRFYRREGFAETARSDGAHNDEGLPDITFEWRAQYKAAA